MGHQSFHRFLNILNRDEGHLDIDLCELGLAIRTEVFIPKASHNLEVSVESGDHQDLFQQLWRLGKGVKIARAEPAGNLKISCPLRGAFEKHRCLNL
jgi:hypothetical protein